MGRTLPCATYLASRRRVPLGCERVAAGRGVIVLAAGASQRMGTPKAMLPWGATTLLESALQQARRAGVEHIVVVLGPATRQLEESLGADLVVTFNPDPETGRSASIR